MSYNTFIKGETGSLSDDRTSIDYDAGDYARYYASFLNPFSDSSKFSREGMLKEARKTAEKAINNNQTNLDKRTVIEQGLGGTKVNLSNLDIQPGETEAQYNKRLSTLQGKATAATRYAAIPGADLSEINDDTSIQQINQLNTGQVETNRKDRKKEAKDDQYELLKWQAMRDDARDNRQDKRLAQDRRLTAETNQMQLQLEYARLAQSEKNRMQDRKDRAIMTLVSGLGNLGAAFAI